MALDVGGRHDEAERGVRVAAHRCSGPTARGTRTTSATTVEGPDARHQRHRLHRQRRVAPLPLHRRHRVPRGVLAASSSARSTTCSTHQTETGRDRVARRRSRRRRAAHRLVEHLRRACAARSRSPSGSVTSAPTGSCRSAALAIAIAHRPDAFLDKDRWAMDWYYPILGGVLRGDAAHAAGRRAAGSVRRRGPRRALRLGPAVGHRRRDVRAGDGARRDRRRRPRALELFTWVQFLRARRRRLLDRRELRRRALRRPTASCTPSSSPPGTRPRSCSRRTRSAATGPTAGLFRGEGLPAGLTAEELIAAGEAIEAERARRRDTRSPSR